MFIAISFGARITVITHRNVRSLTRTHSAFDCLAGGFFVKPLSFQAPRVNVDIIASNGVIVYTLRTLIKL